MNRGMLWSGCCVAMAGMLWNSCGMKKEGASACIETRKIDKVSVQKRKLLPGTWQSPVLNIGETPLWTLTFKEDGSYESFLKPSTHKAGVWEIANDSTLFLYVRDIDRFTIVELNDSLLKIRTEDQWHFQYELRRNKYLGYKADVQSR